MPTTTSVDNNSPFVSYEKLVESVDVLKKVTQIYTEKRNASKEANAKKPLLEDAASHMILLEVNFKKIPINRTTFIHCIELPQHWRHEIDFETCFIVKDLNKVPITDRELDLEQTKSHYRNLLAEKTAGDCVNEILPMRELLNEYKVYEAKRKLCNAFDRFLVDRTLMRSKFDHLPRFLGKTFWSDQKKVPIPIDLSGNDSDLRSQIDAKLNQTFLYCTGKGTTTVVNIGTLKQSTESVAQNLLAVNRKLLEIFGINIRSLKLKLAKSMAITFYLDCGLINDVELPFMNRRPDAVVDEFSHLSNAEVKVFPSGDVTIVPKADNTEEDVEEEEKQFIKKFNRYRVDDGKRRFKRKPLSGRKRLFNKRKRNDHQKSGVKSKKSKPSNKPSDEVTVKK